MVAHHALTVRDEDGEVGVRRLATVKFGFQGCQLFVRGFSPRRRTSASGPAVVVLEGLPLFIGQLFESALIALVKDAGVVGGTCGEASSVPGAALLNVPPGSRTRSNNREIRPAMPTESPASTRKRSAVSSQSAGGAATKSNKSWSGSTPKAVQSPSAASVGNLKSRAREVKEGSASRGRTKLQRPRWGC